MSMKRLVRKAAPYAIASIIGTSVGTSIVLAAQIAFLLPQSQFYRGNPNAAQSMEPIQPSGSLEARLENDKVCVGEDASVKLVLPYGFYSGSQRIDILGVLEPKGGNDPLALSLSRFTPSDELVTQTSTSVALPVVDVGPTHITVTASNKSGQVLRYSGNVTGIVCD